MSITDDTGSNSAKRTRSQWEEEEGADCDDYSKILSVAEVEQLISDVYNDKACMLNFLGNEKLPDGKKKVRDCVLTFSKAILKISGAYLSKLAAENATQACEKVMMRACKSIEKAADALANSATSRLQSPVRSYANMASRACSSEEGFNACSTLISNRVKSCRENPVKRVTVGPHDSVKDKFTSSKATKDVLMKAINPAKLKLNIFRVVFGYNNSVILEGETLDPSVLANSQELTASGLEVKNEQKTKPRVIVHGIPVDLSGEDIIKGIVDQNCANFNHDDFKVVYLYPARDKKFRSCVFEVSAEVRHFLRQRARVNIGWSSCRVEDHVSVLQCFKCLQFGHIAQSCAAETCCAYCAGNHVTNDCTNRAHLKCGNCVRANSNNVSHSAHDKVNCPILCRKINRKISFIDYGC